MKTISLVIGDLLVLYLGLFLTLFGRYGRSFYEIFVSQHFLPFSIIFILWLIVFYIAGLYDFRRLRNNLEFLKTLWLAILVNAVLSVMFFYLVPAFGITPKTNLFIFIVIFGALETIWRRTFNRLTTAAQQKSPAVLIGANGASQEIFDFLEDNPQLGYKIKLWLKKDDSEFSALKKIKDWQKLIKENKIELIIVPRHFKKESELAKIFYQLMMLGIEIYDLPTFYELIFRKIPLANVDEEWFLEQRIKQKKFYDDLKRGLELLVALLLNLILLPLEIVIALLVGFSSAGPTIYKQTRVGQNNRIFILYKFRTMRPDAEKDGPKWTEQNDKRITAIGRVLRYTHLDELPQLFNIIKGDISFVGPRPERPEFVALLSEKIPYYDIRHLVKPGVGGWAQINYRYGASIEDAYQKLEYDIYYLKNRSLILDLAIILKTLKLLLVNPE